MTTTAPEGSLSENIRNLIKAVFTSIEKLFELAGLEGRMAGISLLKIMGFIILGGLCMLTAWLMLMMAVVIWLAWWHINLIAVLLIISAVNLLLLVPIGFYIKSCVQKLFFPATRRQLKASTAQLSGFIP